MCFQQSYVSIGTHDISPVYKSRKKTNRRAAKTPVKPDGFYLEVSQDFMKS
jgi:hypothetical protein